MQKFFLYARKSTDVEDKQVLSIDAQLTELREFAKRENLNIAQEFVEKNLPKFQVVQFLMKWWSVLKRAMQTVFSLGTQIV